MSNLGNLKNRIGEKHTTKQGYEVEIIEYYSYINCTVKFLYNNFISEGLSYQQIQQGKVRNPYHPSVVNVGYIGVGKYKSFENNSLTIVYQKWHSMLVRSYDEKYHFKFPTYIGCSVAEEWHNFQNFAEWYEDNWKSFMDSSWNLDKDILVKGNKIYSPETCCFVPQEINTFFINKKTNGVIKSGKKYRAHITKFNKLYWLGTFQTEKEAVEKHLLEKSKYIKEICDKFKNLLGSVIISKILEKNG